MFQFILSIISGVGRYGVICEAERWRSDPLSHPALRTMNERELGDLPATHPLLPQRPAERCC